MYCWSCGASLPRIPPVTCTSCGVEHWCDPKPCAGALTVHDGKLLLTRRARDPWRDHWDVPGGFCQTGEHPIVTAERELMEEVGLAIRITGYLGTWVDTYGEHIECGQNKATLNIYYHAVPTAGALLRVDPVEVADVGWFEPTRLPDGVAFPGHIVAVLQAWRVAFTAGRTADALPDLPVPRTGQ